MSAYALSKQSKGRISMSTAYRMARLSGRVKNFDAELLEALCDVLAVEPGELLERDSDNRRRGSK
jgi:DNA-binding Xre family transcriptional regulator